MVGDLYVAWEAERSAATIGYTLSREHQHKGYATEAVTTLVEHLFDTGITRVTASVDPANHPSIAVLDRVGFCLESTGRVEVRGEWVDDAVYVMTPPNPGSA